MTQMQIDCLALGGLVGVCVGACAGVRWVARRLTAEVVTCTATRDREGVAGHMPATGDPRPAHGRITAEIEDGHTVVRARPFDWQVAEALEELLETERAYEVRATGRGVWR